MKTFKVAITCTREFTVQAEDENAAEQAAYERFDSAAYGNFNTDYIEEVGDENQDE